ncbi:MAG TPA: metallopeptidase family protein [Polyangiaceae bacterium]|nr:metallopeptidase family protein [Polyangiaceae bacterium]
MTPELDPHHADELLVEIETLRGEDAGAALRKLEAAPPEVTRRAEARLLAADLTWEVAGPDAALPLVEALVHDVPDYADARYLLGSLYDELGKDRQMVEEFLEVLRLDEGLDSGLDAEEGRELEDLIVEAAEDTIAGLPQAFRERLQGVPVLVAARPDEELVREGFDPRALGLFEGPTDAEHQNNDAVGLPTRIVLFSANLVAHSVDEEQLKSEVATTVLHELGHYFGLEEDDMERLGLD